MDESARAHRAQQAPGNSLPQARPVFQGYLSPAALHHRQLHDPVHHFLGRYVGAGEEISLFPVEAGDGGGGFLELGQGELAAGVTGQQP